MRNSTFVFIPRYFYSYDVKGDETGGKAARLEEVNSTKF
jgi:hypothetical protein